jgi:hypothetical protein
MTNEHLFKARSHVAAPVLDVCDIHKLSLWLSNKRVITFKGTVNFEARDCDNGDGIFRFVLGLKSSYRLTGRATQADERGLKSTKYLMGEDDVTPKTKYKELKALFDEHGRSAFDRDGKKLFDNLTAIYGEAIFDNDNAVQKTVFHIKPSVQAERDKATAGADTSHRDDRGFDKEGTRSFRLCPRPSPPYPSDAILTVYDGVNASKKSPAQCAANFAAWGLKYPESEYPDFRADGSGILQGPWELSDYEKKTDRTDVLADKLKVLLNFRNQDPIEPLVPSRGW